MIRGEASGPDPNSGSRAAYLSDLPRYGNKATLAPKFL